MDTKVSIIIPVYNHAALTEQCLDAIFKTSGSNYEVILVDDASSDCTLEMLKKYGDAVRTIPHAANAGFAVTCNDGAAVARGEYLVFLNNDTIPQPGWLDALVNYADAHPAAAAVGAKMLFPDGTIQHAGVVIRQNLGPTHIYAGFPGDHPAANKSRRFQAVTAACLLIRRKDFEWAGGFDPAFHNGFEDVDLCLRLTESGREVHYCHTSVLHHMESRTRDPVAGDPRNFKFYLERWKGRVRPDDIHYYMEDGLLSFEYSLHYPIKISAFPLLMVKAPWDNQGETDRILQERSRIAYKLLQENLELTVKVRDLEMEMARTKNDIQPDIITGSRQSGTYESNGENGTNPEIKILQLENTANRRQLEGLRAMLLDVHEQLLQRDCYLLRERDSPAGRPSKIEELTGFIEQIRTAVARIYRTRRWKWANPSWMVIRLINLSIKPRGYWRIDEILAKYDEWRAKQPELKD